MRGSALLEGGLYLRSDAQRTGERFRMLTNDVPRERAPRLF